MGVRGWSVSLLLLLSACRCGDAVTQVPPAELSATPVRLTLPPAYVGHETRGEVEFTNRGASTADVPVSIDAPFLVSVDRLQLVRGESRALVVTFQPSVAGPASAILKVGALELEVLAEGLAIPACVASTVCADSRFDVTAAQCAETLRPDGATCETSCVTGSCAGGTCLGQLKGCDDRDACTVDGCSETGGCSHAPVTCPAATLPCHVATCDPVTGCGVEAVIDGTLCGPDDCAATQVDVCIVGQCVRRTRNAAGRCVNRWVSLNIPSRSGSAMAYDEVRQRLVLFGGSAGTDLRGDTWEWNGTAWEERLPNTSPSAREGHAMAWDPVRKRVVLFGGKNWAPATTMLSDLWEWDGTTWVQRTTTAAPPPRADHRLAWDASRQRLVLFGGSSGQNLVSVARFADTWEWDGARWSNRTPATGPEGRAAHALGYDATRQRVVLFGGLDQHLQRLDDTWEWDGTSWLRRQLTASPEPSSGVHFAWDARRERLVLFTGSVGDNSNTWAVATWTWDGTKWTREAPSVSPTPRAGYAMGWDGARERAVLFGGFRGGDRFSDSWAWDGTNWARVSEVALPPAVRDVALAYDPQRQRVVWFGGPNTSQTWEWNRDWNLRAPALSPSPRSGHAMTWDSARQRVLLYGGYDGEYLTETWEWDGTSWIQRMPPNSPPACGAALALAFDDARQRAVLHCDQGTWEWNGADWTEADTTVTRWGAAMAWDPVRQRVLLFGGNDSSGLRNELLEWDGVRWTERPVSPRPSARRGHAMAWDTTRQRLVLFGGDGPRRLQDTWEWDGAGWTQRMPVTSPPASDGHSMTFHAGLNRIVLVTAGDTWLFLP